MWFSFSALSSNCLISTLVCEECPSKAGCGLGSQTKASLRGASSPSRNHVQTSAACEAPWLHSRATEIHNMSWWHWCWTDFPQSCSLGTFSSLSYTDRNASWFTRLERELWWCGLYSTNPHRTRQMSKTVSPQFLRASSNFPLCLYSLEPVYKSPIN